MAVVLVLMLILAALAPSAFVAWRATGLNHLGAMHDDATYWATAKALAGGRGYRMLWLPGEPRQTLYPPLYPLLLSTAWRIGGTFPNSAKLAVLLTWLMLPLLLFVTDRLAKVLGAGALARCVLVVWLAWNPIVILLSTSLMSELLFTCAVVTVAWGIAQGCANDSADRIAWWAGCAGAIAYLTRGAGVVLLPAGVICFLVQRKYRCAGLFCAAMAPAIVAWELWIRIHAGDVGASGYRSYLGHFAGTTWSYRWMVLVNNLYLSSHRLADLMLPSSGLPGAEWIGIAIFVCTILALLHGVARPRRPAFAAAWIALSYGVLVVVWPIPTASRYWVPALPLILAYLVSLKPDFLTRHVILAAIATLAGGYYSLISYAAYSGVLPASLKRSENTLREMQPLYHWLGGHSPSAHLFTENAAMVYLRTGRTAVEPTIPVTDWYRSPAEIDAARADRLLEFARREGGLLLLSCASAADLESDSFSPETTHAVTWGWEAGTRANPRCAAFLLSNDICCWRYLSS